MSRNPWKKFLKCGVDVALRVSGQDCSVGASAPRCHCPCQSSCAEGVQRHARETACAIFGWQELEVEVPWECAIDQLDGRTLALSLIVAADDTKHYSADRGSRVQTFQVGSDGVSNRTLYRNHGDGFELAMDEDGVKMEAMDAPRIGCAWNRFKMAAPHTEDLGTARFSVGSDGCSARRMLVADGFKFKRCRKRR